MLEQALAYAERGWAVFPCQGKTPVTRRGLHDATKDPKRIRAFWSQHPRANVAIATGEASGLLVVDIDSPAGEAEVAKLGPAVETLTVITGKGKHLYFARPPGDRWRNTAKKILDVDTRADGGYVIAPPSIHPVTGKAYAFLDPMAPVAALPQHLITALTAQKAKPVTTSHSTVGGVGPLYAESAMRNECRKVSTAPAGTRNDALNIAAHNLGQLVASGMLFEQDVRVALWNAAMMCGLEEDETIKTIESGLSAGLKRPRQVQLREPASSSPISSAPSKDSQALARAPLRVVEPEEVVEAEQVSPEDLLWQAEVQRARDDLITAGFGQEANRTRRQLFMQPASHLFDLTFADTPWLVRGLVTEGDVFCVAGEPKTSKTWAVMELAMAIATRTRAFGEFYVPGQARRVALFLVEDKARATRNRLRALAAGRGMDPKTATENLFVENLVSLNLRDLADLANIVASVRALGPIAALVLDPMRDLHDAEENDSKEMKSVMASIRILRSVLGCAVVFTHHMNKESKEKATDRPAHRMRGSTVIHGAIDAGLYLYGLTGNQETEWVNKAQSEVKAAKSAGFFTLKLAVEDNEVSGPEGDNEAVHAEWVYERKEKEHAPPDSEIDRARQLREAVLRAITQSQTPLVQRDIVRQVHRKTEDVSAAVRDLLSEGRIVKDSTRGYKATLFPVSPRFPSVSGNGEFPVNPPGGAGGFRRETPGNTQSAGNAPADSDDHDEFLDGPRPTRNGGR